MVPGVVRNGPGHRSEKSMVPCGVRNCPNTQSKYRHLSTILSTDLSRSISTVDHHQPTGEYGRYRRSITIHLRRITVDRQSSIKYQDNFAVDLIDDKCETRAFVQEIKHHAKKKKVSFSDPDHTPRFSPPNPAKNTKCEVTPTFMGKSR